MPSDPSDAWDGANDTPRGGRGASLRDTAEGELDALFRLALSRLHGDWNAARDAVQQALHVALSLARPPRDAGAQHAWLRGIVCNVARREARSAARRRGALARLTARARPEHEAVGGGRTTTVDHARDARVREVFVAVSQVPLTHPGAGDLDADGATNTNDFFEFLALYAAGDPGADITGEGDINSNDFFAYLNAYAGDN